MSKPVFGKRYFGGEFSTLMKMVSFDRHVPEFRDRNWEQTETVDGRQFETGYAVVLPLNK